MCGIAGGVGTQSIDAISLQQCQQMTRALSHRGPDAEGYFQEQIEQTWVMLGHRRLSIIDLDTGQQPMRTTDGKLAVIFNGEIYNYREIRHDLQGQGVTFHTESDTETLLHLYRLYGPDMLPHLRGMFAFAIWDQSAQLLFLARDRFGQKPLYYRHEPARFLFASELKALLQLPGLPREPDRQAIDLYLAFQYVPHPLCLLEGYHKLLPGHYAIWQNHQLKIERYWSPPFLQPQSAKRVTNQRSLTENAGQLRKLLTEAVGLRLRSDVPLGAFLSGGIDSTIITALMQQQLDRPVSSFSIGFEQSAYDERSFARMAAQQIGTDHQELIVRPQVIECLPRLIWHYEEPFADSSAIPTMALCEMTSQQVKVALTGDGGDELFAGYDRYRAVELGTWLDRLPGLSKILKSSPLQNFPASVKYKSFSRRLKRFLNAAALPPEERYLQWISQFTTAQRQAVYTADFRAAIQLGSARDWLCGLYQQCAAENFVLKTSFVDQLSYLPGDILTKVDIASMAYGLECRSPFLDHQIGEFAAELPYAHKRRGKIGKLILREAFPDLIPAAILQRQKMGFGVPVDHWFRHELKPLLYDLLLSDRALQRGLFQPVVLEQFINEHVNGIRDHAYRLWSLLVLECWFRMYVDQPPPTSAPNRIS